MQLLPEYDTVMSSRDINTVQIDRHVISKTLNLILSFSWHPSLIDGADAIEVLKIWLDIEHFAPKHPATLTPDFLLIGNCVLCKLFHSIFCIQSK